MTAAGIEPLLVSLVRQSIHVRLASAQRITGTRSRGELYRLRFGLTTEAADEHGVRLASPDDTLRLIVKQGSPDVLARAIRRYASLPDDLKSLFARHVENPPSLDFPPGYLIMQDLADMQPLSEALGEMDGSGAGGGARESADRAARSVASALRRLHNYARERSPVGRHLYVVYLAPMIASLNRLCQPSAYPELIRWVESGLEANGRAYAPFGAYLAVMDRFQHRLEPPALGWAHGDCHSRNLMLSRDLNEARLVDIETLARAEDYLVDYGLLLEDLAVYQSLPYGDEPGRLEWDDLRASESAANYPAFPQASTIVVSFQRRLLDQVSEFARSVADEHWRERLWLSVASGLLLLAGRQQASLPVEPPRRADSLRLVQVAYAESVRLLHELAEHLEGRTPLASAPFPGDGPEAQM